MANIMSLKSVFNKPHRDGFDLSRKNAFSAKLGELLPVMTEDVMPGDVIKIKTEWFTRTQPVTSPAFTRFGEYYDFFFVPYHILWRYFNSFIIQTNDDNWATGINSKSNQFPSHPFISSDSLRQYLFKMTTLKNGEGANGQLSSYWKDINGIAQSYGALKLLDYLGYGRLFDYKNAVSGESGLVQRPLPSGSGVTLINKALNPFPLCAYQKIYNDFYRDKQWESPSPWSYNLDYLTNPDSLAVPLNSLGNEVSGRSSMLTLRYANYNKDYFTGRLPEKQYGISALASPLLDYSEDGTFDRIGISVLKHGSSNVTSVLSKLMPNTSGDIDNVAQSTTKHDIGISALAIRQAEFLQKWKEITLSGGTDYVSQIQKHFGVKPNPDMAHMCTYLGGVSHRFGIDEVTNTNLQGSSAEASLFGKGVNAGNGFVEFDAKKFGNCHGILMCIYHVGLLPEYSSDYTHRLNIKTQATDYVIPEMDNVGMQAVEYGEFLGYNSPYPASGGSDVFNNVVGYVPRYAEYKTHPDEVRGVFANSLTNWVTPLNIHNLPMSTDELERFILRHKGSSFYKIDPHILNSVFSVDVDSTVDTDQFLVNCNFDVKAVRNISRDGLPY